MSEENEDAGLLRRLQRIAVRTVREWLEDDAIRWGAAIAYYSVISLAPLVILATTVLGRVVADDRAERWVLNQVSILAGPQAADVARTVIDETTRVDVTSAGSILSVLLLLFGATAVFANLQRALNRIWSVEPGSGVLRNLVRTRISAFFTVMALGGLILLSVIGGALLGWVGPVVGALAPYLPAARVADFLTSVLILWLAVGAVFWVLPDVKISWRDVWIGALVTALLLVVGKLALAAFLARNAVVSMYGTAGSILLLLLWVYYSAQVFFLGAEFTQVWAAERGREIEPEDYAVRIAEVRRADDDGS